MRVAAMLALATGGCYDAPDILGGLACPDGKCPADQTCVGTDQSNGVCMYGDGVRSPFGTCALLTDSGCEDIKKCTITRLVAPGTTCTEAGTLPVGSACIGYGIFDQCERGTTCVAKVCRALCDASSTQDQCGDNQCVQLEGFALCLEPCDPLAQDCPMANGAPQNCYVRGDAAFCITSEENKTPANTCTADVQCAGGSGCANGVCRTYCDYNAAPDQQGTCLGSYRCRLEVPNANNVGVCS